MKSYNKVFDWGTEWRNSKGQVHREDGPALVWNNGYNGWYLNGVHYSKEEYKRKIVFYNLKKLKI